MNTPVSPLLKISGNPPTKEEARRWIANGIELVAIDSKTNLPIDTQKGIVIVTGPNWMGMASLVNRIVVAID